jgi:membrane-associated HD superfamily phosphohydrolase
MKIMWGNLKSTILEDLKLISLNYRLLIALASLFVIIILLPLFFPAVSHSVYLNTGLQPAKYYTLISITIVSLIPVLTGIAYGRIVTGKTPLTTIKDSDGITRYVTDSTYIRIFISLVISFIVIIISIWLIKPVPSQGWLRTLYAAGLLSVQTPFVFLLMGSQADKAIPGMGILKFYWIFLLALPLGLLVHHPWNYFAFFSPFYWIAWAWMIKPPVESVLCGSIAVILSIVFLFLLQKYYHRR